MDLAFHHFTIKPVGIADRDAAAQYKRDVHEHLRWIHRTTSGRMLLKYIRRLNFPVEIRPHTDATCNAGGGSELKAGAAHLSGFASYTPFSFSHQGSCVAEYPGETRGRLWDEVLFHELVHVFRAASGKWNNAPTLSYAMRKYTSNEEFIAVMVTNIYISDRTNKIKSGLRANHDGFKAMTAEDAARYGLFASSKGALGLVKQFCADHPIFSKALSDQLADVEYNPVADFLRFPAVCQVFSDWGLLKDRTALAAYLMANGVPRATAELAATNVN